MGQQPQRLQKGPYSKCHEHSRYRTNSQHLMSLQIVSLQAAQTSVCTEFTLASLQIDFVKNSLTTWSNCWGAEREHKESGHTSHRKTQWATALHNQFRLPHARTREDKPFKLLVNKVECPPTRL